jgi:uncharacterized membrane protein
MTPQSPEPLAPAAAAAPRGGAPTPIERVISWILRGGVLASLLVLLAGTTISFVHHPGYLYSKKQLAPLTAPGHAIPHTLADVLSGLLAGHGQAIVMAGLLLLVATPVLRVAVSIVAFLWEKDRLFAVITTVVLLLLLLSFFLGKVEG